MDDLKKQLQEALKAELKPFFIGLRNDNKKLIEGIKKIGDKEPPEIQSVKVANPVKKIEITNHPESPRLSIISDSIAKMTSTLTKGLRLVREAIGLQSSGLEKVFTKKTLKVEVKNQIKPPKVQDVKLINPPKEKALQDVFIKNRLPKEAVPVVLTTETLKGFYTVISTMSGGGAGGGGKNLKDLFDILVKIDQNTDTLELKTDQVNLNVDEVEAKLQTLIDKTVPKTSTGNFGSVTVGATATLVRASFANRIAFLATVNTNITVFFGFDNTVTIANGTPLKQDDVFKIDQTNLYTGDIFAIVASGTADVRFMEI